MTNRRKLGRLPVPMQTTIWAALLLMASAAQPAAADDKADVPMGPSFEYPHAGIALALPKGFEYEAPVQAHEVVRAVREPSEQDSPSISLLAAPVKAGTTADTLADETEQASKKAAGIRDFKVLKKTRLPVARLEGAARLVSFTVAGRRTLAVRAYVARELTEPRVRLCYILTVAVPASHQELLLPAFEAVVKTIRLIEFKSPSGVAIKDLGPVARDEKRGYRIRIPRGWHVRPMATGMELLTTDYARGGAMEVRAGIAVGSIGPDTNAAACGLKFLEILVTTSSGPGREVESKVVSRGKAKMAGHEAYQAVVQQTPKAAGPRGQGPLPWIIAQRTICALAKAPGQEGPQRNAYLLSFRCPGTDAKLAAAVLDKLAEGFEIIRPAPQTTLPSRRPVETRPATRPTPSTMEGTQGVPL